MILYVVFYRNGQIYHVQSVKVIRYQDLFPPLQCNNWLSLNFHRGFSHITLYVYNQNFRSRYALLFPQLLARFSRLLVFLFSSPARKGGIIDFCYFSKPAEIARKSASLYPENTVLIGPVSIEIPFFFAHSEQICKTIFSLFTICVNTMFASFLLQIWHFISYHILIVLFIPNPACYSKSIIFIGKKPHKY